MSVLGVGIANGGISLLHALGLGKGCSVGIDLTTRVSIVEGPNREVLEDKKRLLDAVISVWTSEGLPSPDEYYWEIESNVPIGQGLKSSSALACAALRALNSVSWTGLSDNEIADLAVSAQKLGKCTVTGSMDDAWASLSSGWRLVDPTLPASQSVLLPLEALSSNGMAVAASTEDFEALRICNHSIASGAIAAGVSGSGPAVAVVCYESDLNKLAELFSDWGLGTICTRFSDSESVVEEVH